MQSRNILWGACCLSLLAAAGIAYAASLSNADKEFLNAVAKADMVEAHQGQMASDQGASADVKSLGDTLVRDHTANYASLQTLAGKVGVTIPTGIDAAKNADIRPLASLKGAAFDREFARMEVTAHREAIAAFKREAAHGQDPDVKAFASDTIPVLEKHLQLAEELVKPAKHT